MQTTLVETRQGTVQGVQQDAIQVFKGIPFAQPPVGEWRFREPQPPTSWPGIRAATAFGASPIQNSNLVLEVGPMAEDCLYLNVWTPQADTARRPVMVYIYGGSFVSGSSSQAVYNGSAFANDGDIVVVTLNYRVGALGFLYLKEALGERYATSGNNGLLDIIAALRWVHENIASFGGDPAQVTLMGESAGAMSVATLMSMPTARELFTRAIMESGAGQTARDAASAAMITQRLLADARLAATTLPTLPIKDLYAAQMQLLSGTSLSRDFGPVIDGQVLAQYPLDAIQQGQAAHIPTFIGTNHHEANLFVALDPRMAQPSAEILTRIFGSNAPAIQRAYTHAIQQKETREAWAETLTNYQYLIPALDLAAAQAKQGASIWMYRFDWSKNPIGAFHALEVPFVWQTLGQDIRSLRAQLSAFPQAQNIHCGPDDLRLTDQMHAAWIAFIRAGNPNTSMLSFWPQYSSSQRQTMLFNTQSQIVALPPLQVEAGFQSRGFHWSVR
jgi:para-nitrobenzyl esterase